MDIFVVILDHENMGVDTICVTLLFTTTKVIEENTIFDNGGTNLHINIFAQGCHEDNPTKFVQEHHGKPHPPKNLVLIGPPWVA